MKFENLFVKKSLNYDPNQKFNIYMDRVLYTKDFHKSDFAVVASFSDKNQIPSILTLIFKYFTNSQNYEIILIDRRKDTSFINFQFPKNCRVILGDPEYVHSNMEILDYILQKNFPYVYDLQENLLNEVIQELKIDYLFPHIYTFKDSHLKCWSSGRLYLYIGGQNSDIIYFYFCCYNLHWYWITSIAIEDFLKIENKKEYLQNVLNSRTLGWSEYVPNVLYRNEPKVENCRVLKKFKCTWCNSLNEELKEIVVGESSCNLHCKMCRSSTYTSTQGLSNYFKILESLKHLHLKTLGLTSYGEPFLDKKRTLDYLKSLDKDSFEEVSIISNITLLDEQYIKELKNINDTKVKIAITASIDGITKETYTYMRGINCFDKVIKNAKLLYDNKLLGTVNFMVTENTFKEISKVKEFYIKNGMPNMWIQFIKCESQDKKEFHNDLSSFENSFEVDQLKNQGESW